MSTNNIDRNEVLNVDGGLAYILHRYPDAAGCENDTRKRFKMRQEEKHASAAMKRLSDGRWGVTDFGGDSKFRGAIEIAMLEDGVDFRTALDAVAAFYNIGGAKIDQVKATYDKWPAKPDETDGATIYVTKELTAPEIKMILTTAAWNALHKTEGERLGVAKALFACYHLKSVEYKRSTSKGVTHEFRSNDGYPMFVYEEEANGKKWGRFYEPKADKKYRFAYFGEKPQIFIHGMEQLRRKYADINKGDKEYEKLPDDEKQKARREEKVPEVIICSGGSDALNTAAMGYQVLWRNSESESWTEAQYKELKKLAEMVYNLPDIDLTGVRQGHKMALQFLDLRTIWLPDRMLERRDGSGKPIHKDLRDFLRFPNEAGTGTCNQYDFKDLLKTALPYEFWDYEIKRDKDGEPKMKHGRLVMEYKPNNIRILNFLYRMGYCRIKSEKAKEGYVFARVENNIVREVEVSEMDDFINNFLESRFYTEDLRNAFLRSPQLNATSLAKIKHRDIDVKAYGPDHQYFFFENVSWKITAGGIEEQPPGLTEKCVYEDKVLKLETFENNKSRRHKAKKEEPLWKAEQLPSGAWQVVLLRKDCVYFNYIVQTCRMFWREELEERLYFDEHFDTTEKRENYIKKHHLGQEQLDAIAKYSKDIKAREQYLKDYHVAITSPLLTREENEVQMTHLANRLYVIGFALHRFKISSKDFCIWSMDNRISDEGESYGGSGKSLTTRGLEQILRVVTLPSRIDKIENNPFVFENVTPDADLVLMDDTHQHLTLSPFFPAITGTWVVNRKNMKSIAIPFRVSPKLWFNTNFGDKEQDPSTQRRKMHTVYSDYYHSNSTGQYEETRTPGTDLGVTLFDEFDATQWNLFYNVMASALHFFLMQDTPVRAPGENIQKRNLMAIMGDTFKGWADVYFSKEMLRLDNDVIRDDAQEAFFKINKMTPQLFKKKLKAWCKLYGFVLNPKDLCTQGERIIKNVGLDGVKEVFYIKTFDEPVADSGEGEGLSF